MRKISIILPNKAIELINQVIEQHGIFEDHNDFVLHAITDLVEKYK